MSDLIDTTEMYLRTIYELLEEGIPPLRARIVERLGQSGPTVSQTVARMERDGLLTVQDDRHLELSPQGQVLAARVMRKHRLAECLLIGVLGLDWPLVHEEACRWEHVISEAVELRVLELLDHPQVSPYGNPIPALDELGVAPVAPGPLPLSLAGVLERSGGPATTRLERISEVVQGDADLLGLLGRAGVRPGARLEAEFTGGALQLVTDQGRVTVETEVASHLYVDAG